MSRVHPAVHRAILVTDVDKFGDPARTNPHQIAVRDGMYTAITRAFTKAKISWAACNHEDRGDGVLVLVPPQAPKNPLVTRLPVLLAAELARHNAANPAPAQIRLRMALHAGEIHHDRHGVAGTAINRTSRLADAPALKTAFAATDAVLALIVSEWIYDEVVRDDPSAHPSRYRKIRVTLKETHTSAWVRILGPTGTAAPPDARLN
ncbi:MAG TPA: hypothetical protein VF933_09440 [Streptosporangiaceae bacterium]